MRLIPANKLRPQTKAIPGYNHFLTPLRKLVLDYSALSPVQAGLRDFIKGPFVQLAKENPDVEFVVRQIRRNGPGLLRGHYVNGKEKVICVNKLEKHMVNEKFKILLNSSGSPIKNLKNDQLEAAPGSESARGIWSSIHAQSKAGGGFRI